MYGQHTINLCSTFDQHTTCKSQHRHICTVNIWLIYDQYMIHIRSTYGWNIIIGIEVWTFVSLDTIQGLCHPTTILHCNKTCQILHIFNYKLECMCILLCIMQCISIVHCAFPLCNFNCTFPLCNFHFITSTMHFHYGISTLHFDLSMEFQTSSFLWMNIKNNSKFYGNSTKQKIVCLPYSHQAH